MSQKRVRDSQKSREDILKAAEEEFAAKGIYGTRVDEIAARARINKRMIYEYYGNKEELYKAVLIAVYGRLSQREVQVLSEEVSSREAIRNIIHLYFDFLKENPTYVNLLLWENLNKGKYISEVDVSNIKNPTLDLMRKVINRGKDEGVFKKEIDTEQVIISLLMYTFSYFSNRYTLSRLVGKSLDNEDNIRARAENVTEMFISYLCRT